MTVLKKFDTQQVHAICFIGSINTFSAWTQFKHLLLNIELGDFTFWVGIPCKKDQGNVNTSDLLGVSVVFKIRNSLKSVKVYNGQAIFIKRPVLIYLT